ncbi:MAG: hypothetical protein CMN27_13785 [Salinisphaera sp.]|nr:hypothetical protein [Salinisphaera sp.]
MDASIISIEQPSQADQVWLGYSRAWLTRKALKQLRANDILWNGMMIEVAPSSLVSGGAVPDDVGFRASDADTLNQAIPEYGFADFAQRYYAWTLNEAVNRGELAEQLVERMKQISPEGGVVVGLNDPVGNVRDAAAWRNIKAGELAHFKTVQSDLEPVIIRELIEGVRQSMQANNQADTWAERYAPKLDMGKLEADKEQYEQQENRYRQPLDDASADWAALVGRPLFGLVWMLYDGTHRPTGRALECDFADCFEGVGASEKERAIWKEWVQAEPDDDDHPLWYVLAAGDPDVHEFVLSHTTDFLSMFGSARDAANNIHESITSWLHSSDLNHSNMPAVQAATGTITHAIVAYLPRMAADNVQPMREIGARLQLLRTARTGIIVYPQRLQAPVHHLTIKLYETVWGQAGAGLPQRSREGQIALIKHEGITGGFAQPRPGGQDMLTLDLYLTSEDFSQAGFDADFPTGDELNQAFKQAAFNPYHTMAEDIRNAGQRMVSFSGALSLYGLASALASLNDAQGAAGTQASENLSSAHYAVVSGVLGVSSVFSEAMGQTLKQRAETAVADGAENAAAQIVRRAIAWRLAGGLFAVGASFSDAIKHGIRAGTSFSEGDNDAAWCFIGSTVAYGASGIASAAAIFAQVNAMAAAGSTTAAMTSWATLGLGASSIPVIGWTVLAFVALGAAVYLTYLALKNTDTPLEVWFTRCYYRNPSASNRDAYANLQKELAAYQDVVYGLSIRLVWQNEPGRDRVQLRVIIPGIGDYSDYAYKLMLAGEGGHSVIAFHGSQLSHDPALQPRQNATEGQEMHARDVGWGESIANYLIPRGTEARKAYRYIKHMGDPVRYVTDNRLQHAVQLEQHAGAAVLQTEVLVDEDVYDRVGLKIEYWPDALNKRQLVMSLDLGEADYSWARKEGFWSYLF